MKCEGEKTYDQPGRCPVCHMKLKALSAPATLTVEAADAALITGRPVPFTLHWSDTGTHPTGPLVVVLVSPKLQTLPVSEKPGAAPLTFEATFTEPGQYRVLAIPAEANGFVPTYSAALTLREAGTPAIPAANPADAPVIITRMPELKSAVEATITITLTTRGKPTPEARSPTLRYVLFTDDFSRATALTPITEPGTTYRFKFTPPAAGTYRAVVTIPDSVWWTEAKTLTVR